MREKANRILAEVKKAVVGKDEVSAKVLMAILSGGHILLEDSPGVGKTTMALAFSRAMQLNYQRIQFTPEIMPADVIGFSLYDHSTGSLSYQPGPIFCNLFLADEINRTSSKTQSALLEAMEEGQVTVEGASRPLPVPFTVIATQNPAGSAGTQLLPESQLDRFLVRLSIGYPTPNDEVEILKRKQQGSVLATIQPVASAQDLLAMQKEVQSVYLSDELYHYIAVLTGATRNHHLLLQGASPRGSIALAQMGRACAWLQGRDYVVPKDLQQMAFAVLEHRLLINSQARLKHMDAHAILAELLKTVPAPKLLK